MSVTAIGGISSSTIKTETLWVVISRALTKELISTTIFSLGSWKLSSIAVIWTVPTVSPAAIAIVVEALEKSVFSVAVEEKPSKSKVIVEVEEWVLLNNTFTVATPPFSPIWVVSTDKVTKGGSSSIIVKPMESFLIVPSPETIFIFFA